MEAASTSAIPASLDDSPPHRYNNRLANQIENFWQNRWASEGTFNAPNPSGPLGHTAAAVTWPKLYVLDMLPHASGVGLHMGDPLGYIATDVFARFARMKGLNVLHAIGYDAFGPPAEQYAIDNGQHPEVTTEANIATMRRQLRRLGLGHDHRREVATTDPSFYRWTQWIFLQLFDSWFDPAAQRARPIAALRAQFDSGERTLDGEPWREWKLLSEVDRRKVLDGHRLAYVEMAPVNWCPGLGTVLVNEEVTADGRSKRGNYPVFRRPLRQWKLRITAYARRLLEDLDCIDWPESIKSMQRNWIGLSAGACIDFYLNPSPRAGLRRGIDGENVISVFTTRPDTLFGATYVVVAPEHPILDQIVEPAPGAPPMWPGHTPASWRGTAAMGAPNLGWVSPYEAVRGYRRFVSRKSDIERKMDTHEISGVFAGLYANNPATGDRLPVFVADYVLTGHEPEAIMAVPAHDQRDFDFARDMGLPIVAVVRPPEEWMTEHMVTEDTSARGWPTAFEGQGLATGSANTEVSLDGLPTSEAKRVMLDWLETAGFGTRETTYHLRDWLFSRQRYWGEPFPIVYDQYDLPIALSCDDLPVELPAIADFEPTGRPDDEVSDPKPPLSRAEDWVTVTLDLGEGPKEYRRELSTMPSWAGSCWYFLRYLDPRNGNAFVDAEVERYWMLGARPDPRDGGPIAGGVDLYVGGVEHAVLNLLYARFWHKVLFDLGHVSTPEPFHRLFNRGCIQADAFKDKQGFYVDAGDTEDRGGGKYFYRDEPVTREHGKMGKNLKNVVAPDEICDNYGADTLRLYAMSTAPLDADRPWRTRDIVVVHRFLQRLWRNIVNEQTGALRVCDDGADSDTRRLLHRTIDAVRRNMETLCFNTSIAGLIELNNALTSLAGEGDACPREVAEALVLMLAPLAPHVSEELWALLGHDRSIAYEPFPEADPALFTDDGIRTEGLTEEQS